MMMPFTKTIAIACLIAVPALAVADQTERAAATQFTPPPAKKGYAYPDCFCTDSNGQRIELGQAACLTIGTRSVTARCSMSLNNPTWRTEHEGCVGV